MADQYFSIDVEDLERLTHDLDAASRALKREADLELLAVGEAIKKDAQVNASKHSTTIPRSLHVKAAEGVIEIKSDLVLAGLYEQGNRRKGAGGDRTFWHPVFGDQNNIVEQPRYPFMKAAVIAGRVLMVKGMDKAIDRALDEHDLPVGEMA